MIDAATRLGAVEAAVDGVIDNGMGHRYSVDGVTATRDNLPRPRAYRNRLHAEVAAQIPAAGREGEPRGAER